jgi:Na+/H+-dicarboxylate symporter
MKFLMQILIALGLGVKRNGHIFLGLIAGIVLGFILHNLKVTDTGELNTSVVTVINVLDFVGQVFIRAIQMVVIPLICSAIVVGIASIGDSKQLGKFGKKMVLYYGIISACAVGFGAILASIFKPGIGVQAFISQSSALSAQAQVQEAILEQQGNISKIFLDMIPDNPVAALANGDIISVLVFTIVFAVALAKIGDVARPIVGFFESVFAATMKVTDWIMYLAAPGVFALAAVAVSSYGTGIFSGISSFFLVVMLGILIQLCLVYPIMIKAFSNVPVAVFFSAIVEAMMVAFGTASSSATLPVTMACCEKRGISHKVCSFVIPLGATLNMDGTAMFQTMAVLFLTQAYGVTLEPVQIIQVAFFAFVASSTCAGIPGAGIITLSLILNGLGLTPQQLVEGFAFLFAIDRIVDMFRSVLNVTSDAAVAAVIADNENEIDYDLFNNVEAYKDIVE